MISIQVNADGAAKSLTRLALSVNDRRVPNRQLAVQLQGHVFREFKTEGAFNGGNWAPLAESTARRKVTKAGQRRGFHPILMVTGHLRNSYLSFYDDTKAGVGSEVEYAPYHEEGAPPHLPKRSVLPTEKEALDYAVRIYGLYVEKSIREAAR